MENSKFSNKKRNDFFIHINKLGIDNIHILQIVTWNMDATKKKCKIDQITNTIYDVR